VPLICQGLRLLENGVLLLGKRIWIGPGAALGCVAFELKAIAFAPWLRRRWLYPKVYLPLFERFAILATPGDNSAYSLTKF
jgi:hypothetical protein